MSRDSRKLESRLKLFHPIKKRYRMRFAATNKVDEVRKITEEITQTDPVVYVIFSEQEYVDDDLSFASMMRDLYPDRCGALLVSDQSIDPDVARAHGVYRVIKEPLNSEDLDTLLGMLSDSIRLRHAPQKRDTSKEFALRTIESVDEFNEYLELRYRVWDIMGYIPDSRRNTSRLEIDKYDNYSVPFGCFLNDGSGKLIGLLRLVTPNRRRHYADVIREIVDETQDDVLKRIISTEPETRIIAEESYPIAGMISGYENNGRRVCELSRTIADPSYRGFGVGGRIMEFGIAHALREGYEIAFGGCVPAHLPFYAKFGYHEIPGAVMMVETNVGQASYCVVSDFRKLPNPASTNVVDMMMSMEAGDPTIYV